ncbi:hypothetical protein QIS74_06106 [Colletotrichum tabaci]|uniref:F-box domain-containing protein n=1 Tax=Colletotrichum tabaci TaxID=1209068 RepID=A0AAV9TDQ2_9PEZI
MSVESRRPSRLGIRSLARKSTHFASRLKRSCHAHSAANGIPSIPVISMSKLLLLSDSDLSENLPVLPTAGGPCSTSSKHLWSGTHLHLDSSGRTNPEMDNQLETGFLGRLPDEIREMIYQELWRAAGLGQHIIRTQAGYAHSRCLFHRVGSRAGGGVDGEDPWESNWMAPDARGPVPLWFQREMSTWCDHWKCEEAREEREIWRDITSRSRTYHCARADTWTAFLPMMLTCKRMYFECASSIYDSVAFTITDINLARNVFCVRHRGPIGGGGGGHPLRRINLSFRRQADEGSNFEQWVESWSAVLRHLDTPGLAAVNLWLDSDVYYERHWLSVSGNVLRRVPEALADKVAVSLPPDGHRDRAVGGAWQRGDGVGGARCFDARRVRS